MSPKRTKRTKSAAAVVLCLLLAPTLVLATGDLRDDWLAAYPDACQALRSAATNCSLCHTSVPSRNDYGRDIATYGISGAGSRDSDGDSRTNLQEIEECTLPGDPTSTPVETSTWGAIKVLFE